MTKTIRVLIADNNPQFLQQLALFLEQQDGISVVYTARDGQGAVDACRESLPDLAVIDLHLPVLDSIRAIKLIVAQNEHIKILGMSEIPNDRYAIEAVKAGASGFVKKNDSLSYPEIASAIRQVAQGEVVLNPILASNILEEFS
ncbi:MAG: Oxygen regulatory protein NreC [Anaerolineae bacterium]|nr:Oxygen regulatory protein NreC [Anaerolineae bacterium]